MGVSRWGYLVVGAISSLVASCTLVNAFDEVTHRPATGGEGGMAGSGGQGGELGGAGGEAPIDCELGKIGSCGLGRKCSVNDEGATGCVLAGSRTAFQRCEADVDCGDGSWCDIAQTRVCKPICQNADSCPPNGRCVAATGPAAEAVGLKICTSNCEPIGALPCDVAGNVTCINGIDGFDCAASEGGGYGLTCMVSEDCMAGLLCIAQGNGTSLCQAWCTPTGTNADCMGGFCSNLGPPALHDGVEYGGC